MNIKRISKINKIRLWVIPLPVVLLAVLVFGGVGVVGALNGWFGGGGSVPSDTFTRGLAGYWSFDEGFGGIANDSSGNNNRGVLKNYATSTVAIRPNGAGSETAIESVVGAGTHWEAVDETVADDGTTSVQETRSGTYYRDLYTLTDPIGSIREQGIRQIVIYVRNRGNIYNGNISLRTHGTTYNGSRDTGSGAWTLISESWATNPNTGNPWTWDEIDDLEAGTRLLVGAGGYGNTSQVYVEVDYYLPPWTSGKIGSALEFDGTNDYVDLPNTASLYPTQFSISSWVKTSTSTAGDGNLGQIIFSNYEGLKNFIFYLSNTGLICIRPHDGSTNYGLCSTNALTVNTWYFVTATFDGTNLAIYINGANEGSRAASHLAEQNAYAAIGQGPAAGGYYFYGFIDELRLYNRALSVAEVRYHYNRGGPVAYWKFDEGSGSTAYNSAATSTKDTFTNGILCSEMSTSTSGSSGWVAGKYGTALSFDGTNDYVDLSGPILGTKSVTFNAWFNIRELKSDSRYLTSVRQVGGDYDYGFYISIRNNGILNFASGDGGSGGLAITATSPLQLNTWYHVTAIRDTSRGNTVLSLYINGILIGTKTWSGLVDLPAFKAIGRHGATGYNFPGIIDEVKIYDYVRTPEEIRLDYNAGFAAHFGPQSSCDDDPGACMTQGLLGYWDMEEGSGRIVHDRSGNNNNGSTTNMTTPWTSGVVPLSGVKKGGSALYFDGVDDYVCMGNAEVLNFERTDPFSVEGWFKKETDGDYIIVSRQQPSDTYRGWRVYFNTSTKKLEFGLFNISATSAAIVATTQSLSGSIDWTHFIFTYDGSSSTGGMKGYINGVPEALTTTQNNLSDTTKTTVSAEIGARGGSALPFNGFADEIRIYNRVLSDTEVRYHYNKSGPIARWKLDEGSGSTVYDSTSNDNDCTMYWMSTSTQGGWVTGKYGSALSFDGLDDYADCGSNETLNSSSSVAVSAWVKLGELGRYQRIVQKKYGAPQYANYVLEFLSTNKVRFRLGDGAADHNFDSVSSLTTGVWYHLMGTYDGTNGKIYINGVLDSKKTDAFTLKKYSNNLNLGGMGGENTFKGLIDEVSVYNYARSAEEVRSDYNAGLAAHFGPKTDCNTDPGACMTEGLVGYWDMEEGTGSLIHDKSGNNNSGVMASMSNPWIGGIVPYSGGKVGGSALSFDGVDDYVSLPTGVFDALADTSIEMWYKCGSTGNQALFGNYKDDNNYIYFGVLGSKLSMAVVKSGIVYIIYSNSNVVAGDWYHIVGLLGSGGMKLYVNGILQSDTDVSTKSFADVASAVNVRISSMFGVVATPPYRPVNGFIDEVRVYNRVLSATEVRYHYNKGGPVGWWKMDEGEGSTVYDSTNNNNDGTLVLAGSATSSAWVSGKYGSALSFDGVDDYVNCGSEFIGTSAVTVEAWIYPNSWEVAGVSGRRIVDNGKFGFRIFTPGFLRLSSDGDSTSVDSATSLTLNTWQHIVVSRTAAGAATFYINGVLSGTPNQNSGTPANGTTNVIIGNRLAADRAFPGLIDEVRIYNYARTPAQIQQDYNAGLSTHFK